MKKTKTFPAHSAAHENKRKCPPDQRPFCRRQCQDRFKTIAQRQQTTDTSLQAQAEGNVPAKPEAEVNWDIGHGPRLKDEIARLSVPALPAGHVAVSVPSQSLSLHRQPRITHRLPSAQSSTGVLRTQKLRPRLVIV